MVEKQKFLEIAGLVYDIIQESGGQTGEPYVSFTVSNISMDVWAIKKGFDINSEFDYHKYVDDKIYEKIVYYLKNLLKYAKERRTQCTSDLARNQENE